MWAGYRDVVRRALAEDIGGGDVTSRAIVPQGLSARGTLVVKSPCVLAGLDVAAEAFRQLDSDITFASCRTMGARAVPATPLRRLLAEPPHF